MLDTQQLQQKTSEELIQVIVELDAKNQQLQEKLTLLLSRQYKRKSEDVNQFDEPTISLDETKAVEEAEEAIRIPAHQRTEKKRAVP